MNAAADAKFVERSEHRVAESRLKCTSSFFAFFQNIREKHRRFAAQLSNTFRNFEDYSSKSSRKLELILMSSRVYEPPTVRDGKFKYDASMSSLNSFKLWNMIASVHDAPRS